MSATPYAESDGRVIADYYDKDIQRCLRDFVYGNRRIRAAVDRVLSHMSGDVRSILDVGCGAGLAAAVFRDANPHVQVHGVDISAQRIEIAKALFGGERITFEEHDMSTTPSRAPYDLISLIDVYEHVPSSRRPSFNNVLGRALSPNGMIVLTTPSFLHQQYLAREKPEGLQVVDETIGFNDVASLADQVGAEIVVHEMVSIWNSNDYVHTVLARCPRYAPLDQTTPPRVPAIARIKRRIERRRRDRRIAERKRLVFETLHLHVE